MIGVSLLGAVYVRLIILFMEHLHNLTGDLLTDASKIIFVSISVFLSCLLIFLFNSYILKGNKKHLGYWCSLFAFIYFYIVKADEGTLAILVGTFLYLYSTVAFFLFLLTPILIGEQVINRITRRSKRTNNP